MLEYFTIKKFRKNHKSTSSTDSTTAPNEPLTPLLSPHDERFLAQVIDEPEVKAEPETVIFEGPQPPQTPIAPDTPVKTTTGNKPKVVPPAATGDGDWKESLWDKWGYLEALGTATASRIEQAVVRKGKDQGKGKEKATEPLADRVEPTTISEAGNSEILREDQELTDILERLNCAASNGTVLSSPSASIKPLIGRFTQIFKDLMNGVPTAYDDLVSLFDSSSNLMEKTYSSLPNFMKQIIQSMPDKMKPEVLRTLVATSPALANAGRLGLREMVTTPGVLSGLLKGIVQALKTRFPMLMGGGVAVGLGVLVLFFGLWYCYKRGKETREEREERERMEAFGVERIKTEKELGKEKKEKEKKEKKEKTEKADKEKSGQETGGPAEEK